MIHHTKTVRIIPDFPIGSVEDMRTVFMHLNPSDFFGKNIACDVVSFVDNQYVPALPPHFMCIHTAKQSRAYHQIVKMLHVMYFPNSARSPM